MGVVIAASGTAASVVAMLVMMLGRSSKSAAAGRPALADKPRPRRSRGAFVLVEDAAEAIASSDVEAGQLVRVGDRGGQRVQRAGVRDALVRAVSVVVMRVILSRVWL